MTEKSQQTITEDSFSELFLDGIKRSDFANLRAEYDRSLFKVKFFNGDKLMADINLRNLFIKYSNTDPANQKEQLALFIRALTQSFKNIPDSFDQAKGHLLPKVMSRANFVNSTMLSALTLPGGEETTIPHEIIAEDLVVALAFDTPDSTAIVNLKFLSNWGITFEKGMKIGLENLAELTVRKGRLKKVSDNLFAWDSDDSHDASRILLKEQIRMIDIKGFPVAYIPNRDHLYITGSENPKSLETACQKAQEDTDNSYPISGRLYVLKGNQWLPWAVKPTDDSYGFFKNLEYKRKLGEYGEQKRILQEKFDKDGQEAFIATFGLMQHRNNQNDIFSHVVLTKGVDTLLPKAERITFLEMNGVDGRDGFSHATVDWSLAQKVLGQLFEPLEYYPPLFRVRSFPEKRDFVKMGVSPTAVPAGDSKFTPFSAGDRNE